MDGVGYRGSRSRALDVDGRWSDLSFAAATDFFVRKEAIE